MKSQYSLRLVEKLIVETSVISGERWGECGENLSYCIEKSVKQVFM